MHTELKLEARKFKIQISDERPEPPLECRFNRSGVSGVIKNQDIPIELTNYSVEQQVPIDCMWNITVKEGYKVRRLFG